MNENTFKVGDTVSVQCINEAQTACVNVKGTIKEIDHSLQEAYVKTDTGKSLYFYLCNLSKLVADFKVGDRVEVISYFPNPVMTGTIHAIDDVNALCYVVIDEKLLDVHVSFDRLRKVGPEFNVGDFVLVQNSVVGLITNVSNNATVAVNVNGNIWAHSPGELQKLPQKFIVLSTCLRDNVVTYTVTYKFDSCMTRNFKSLQTAIAFAHGLLAMINDKVDLFGFSKTDRMI